MVKPLSRIGSYVNRTAGEEAYQAFVPPRLPPDPSVDLVPMYGALDKASRALGSIDALNSLVPDVSQFLFMYVRKEALLSSQIEGTQSSLVV